MGTEEKVKEESRKGCETLETQPLLPDEADFYPAPVLSQGRVVSLQKYIPGKTCLSH